MRKDKATKLCLTGVLSLAVILTVYVGGVLAKQEGHPQTLCPIMGGQIDRSAYVDYEGKRMYFCCPGCKATFLENPEKYVKDMEAKGIQLEKAPQAKKGKEGQHGHGPGTHPSGTEQGNHGMHGGSMH